MINHSKRVSGRGDDLLLTHAGSGVRGDGKKNQTAQTCPKCTDASSVALSAAECLHDDLNLINSGAPLVVWAARMHGGKWFICIGHPFARFAHLSRSFTAAGGSGLCSRVRPGTVVGNTRNSSRRPELCPQGIQALRKFSIVNFHLDRGNLPVCQPPCLGPMLSLAIHEIVSTSVPCLMFPSYTADNLRDNRRFIHSIVV